ncbi:MAG: peptidylprolyl isomerase [Clostridia bacterium]|nr:peptidylprolyl isomerase [Clostridia bacterium]
MKKIFKKVLCSVLALTATVSSVAMFTACETDNPEVKMQIEFDGETYTLHYKLYRKIAPATVKHFLKLVEKKYYNDVCIHDYDVDGGKLYTGGYTYVAGGEHGGIVEKDYFNTVSAYEHDWTVFTDAEKTTPTYTLYGEFEDNSFKVKNGDLSESFGSLTMYYSNKKVDEGEYMVSVVRADGSGVSSKDYRYNSATSLFSISLSDSSTNSKAYCTFATLQEGSVDDLEDLKAALEAYEGDFVEEYVVDIDDNDPFVGTDNATATYSVPVSPITIKKVTVEKY